MGGGKGVLTLPATPPLADAENCRIGVPSRVALYENCSDDSTAQNGAIGGNASPTLTGTGVEPLTRTLAVTGALSSKPPYGSAAERSASRHQSIQLRLWNKRGRLWHTDHSR